MEDNTCKEFAASCAVLDLVPLGAMLLDSGYRVVFWNKYLENWTKVFAKDLLGQDIRDLYPHIGGRLIAGRLNEIFQGGAPLIFSSHIHKSIIPASLPNGGIRLQHTTVVALKDNCSSAYLALFLMQDVTETHTRLTEYAKMRNLAMQELEERKRAEMALLKGHREQSILYSISSKASESLDLNVVLRHAQEVLREAFDTSAVTAFLLDQESNVLLMHSSAGLWPDLQKLISRLQLDQGIAGRAVNTGKPIFCSLEDHPSQNIRELLQKQGFLSAAAFPILTQGRAVGALSLLFDKPRQLDADELTLLGAIGVQLGMAVKNAQLYESVSRELGERAKAEAFTKSILDSLSASVAILDHTGTILDHNSAWKKYAQENGLSCTDKCAGANFLQICDAATGELSGGAKEAGSGIRKVLSGKLVEYQQTYECSTPEKARWYNMRVTKVAGTRPVKVVMAHEDVTELKLSEQKLRQLSQRDGLTGLANRRYFDEILQREWMRALRNQKPLAFFMADIDHFKAYNDCYGHLMGDECIKMVARALNGILRRPTDLAVRYGGEEFGALLPETELNGASHIAEAFHQAVLAEGMAHLLSTVSPVVSLSIGVACLIPGRGVDPTKLIELADSALYRAKQGGRNRICLA